MILMIHIPRSSRWDSLKSKLRSSHRCSHRLTPLLWFSLVLKQALMPSSSGALGDLLDVEELVHEDLRR